MLTNNFCNYIKFVKLNKLLCHELYRKNVLDIIDCITENNYAAFFLAARYVDIYISQSKSQLVSVDILAQTSVLLASKVVRVEGGVFLDNEQIVEEELLRCLKLNAFLVTEYSYFSHKLDVLARLKLLVYNVNSRLENPLML